MDSNTGSISAISLLGLWCALAIGGAGLAVLASRAPGTPAARPGEIRLAPALNGAIDGAMLIDADRHGHFRANVTLYGRQVRMLVDTGASSIALSWEDAQRLGVRPGREAFRSRARTANGEVWVASITIPSVTLGYVTIREVEAVVLEQGRLSESLLGMSFLGRVRTLEIGNGVLRLEH